MDIPEDADISCHFQEVTRGIIRCIAARESERGDTDRVTPETCYTCKVGLVYREVGCDQLSPDIIIHSLSTHDFGYQPLCAVTALHCGRRLRQTTLEECRICTLVPAETTREIVSTTLGLFQAQGFTSAYNDLLEARNELRDGDYDDSIGKAINCLESTIRCVHEELGVPLPSKRTVTGLWQSTKDLLKFNDITTEAQDAVTALIGSLSGTVSHLGGMRNVLGDSHGKGLVPVEVSEALAELAINAAATVSTVIIRRHRQLLIERE